MDKTHHLVFTAFDRSYLALLKREIQQLAVQVGFSGHRLAEFDLIVAEIATNLIKHAGGGEILVRLLEQPTKGLELIGFDNGPGMSNPARMLEDGISTTNTLGHGLGSIQRLSDEFSLYSQPKWGTVILSRVYLDGRSALPHTNGAAIRSLLIPKPGELVCGDGFAVKVSQQLVKVFLGDGLGHGPEAHKAVQTAIQAFQSSMATNPVELLQEIHRAVTKTRGLVGTVAVLDKLSNKWKVCGIGNITARLHNLSLLETPKTFLSYNGILGLNMPRTINEQVAPYQRGQTLLLGSDGLRSRWDASRYPSIRNQDPTILATALYKDYARRTDDTSIAVVQL